MHTEGIRKIRDSKRQTVECIKMIGSAGSIMDDPNIKLLNTKPERLFLYSKERQVTYIK